MLSKERLRLLDVLSDFHEGVIDTTDDEFGIEACLIQLTSCDSVPLSRGEQFLKNLLIPSNGVCLDEVDLAEFCLDLGETFFIEFIDNYLIETFEALVHRFNLSLQDETLINEGVECFCIGVGCHSDHLTSRVCQTQPQLLFGE